MKKIMTAAAGVILWVASAVNGNAQSGEQAGAFGIRAQLEGLEKVSAMVLFYNLDGENFKDTVEVNDGRFSFSGQIPRPVKGWISPLRAPADLNFNMPVYIEASDIEISGIISTPYDLITNGRIRKKLDTDRIKITGSATHRQFETLLRMSREYLVKRSIINYQWAKSREVGDDAWLAEVQEMSRKVSGIRADAYAQFIREHPDSYVTLELFDFLQSYLEDDRFRELYAMLSPELKATGRGKELGVFVEARKNAAIGQTVPDFTQKNPNGKPVSISDYRGKYVLIDFWASWCGPCRAENPNLVENYDEYKNDGFMILGVSLDRDKEAWVKAIEKDGLTWPQVSDLNFWRNAVALQFGVPHVPYNVLVDPEGKIIAKGLRGDGLDKKLAELLE